MGIKELNNFIKTYLVSEVQSYHWVHISDGLGDELEEVSNIPVDCIEGCKK